MATETDFAKAMRNKVLAGGFEEPAAAGDFRPSPSALSNDEVRATGLMVGGAVQAIARELLERRAAPIAPAAQDGWLNVTDDQPAMHEDVLITYKGKTVPAYLDAQRHWVGNGGITMDVEDVRKWRPLPAPSRGQDA